MEEKKKLHNITIRVDDELLEKINSYCRYLKISRSEVIRRAFDPSVVHRGLKTDQKVYEQLAGAIEIIRMKLEKSMAVKSKTKRGGT